MIIIKLSKIDKNIELLESNFNRKKIKKIIYDSK